MWFAARRSWSEKHSMQRKAKMRDKHILNIFEVLVQSALVSAILPRNRNQQILLVAQSASTWVFLLETI